MSSWRRGVVNVGILSNSDIRGGEIVSVIGWSVLLDDGAVSYDGVQNPSGDDG